MSLVKEFKEFISRGNVVDMAVGVIIGGAFTSIVTSLTNDILTPFISFLTGKINISKLAITITDNLTIPYGMFLQTVINFLLTAIAVFVFAKIMNSFRAKMEARKESHEEEEEVIPELTSEEKLLTEIRDLLKNRE